MNLPEQILLALRHYPLEAICMGLFILACLITAQVRRHYVYKQIVKGGAWQTNSKDTE